MLYGATPKDGTRKVFVYSVQPIGLYSKNLMLVVGDVAQELAEDAYDFGAVSWWEFIRLIPKLLHDWHDPMSYDRLVELEIIK